jgi:hypothetical protein
MSFTRGHCVTEPSARPTPRADHTPSAHRAPSRVRCPATPRAATTGHPAPATGPTEIHSSTARASAGITSPPMTNLQPRTPWGIA